MDETMVKRVLASYCPPLSPAQVEAAASEIAELSKKELSDAASKVAARRLKRSRKSRSQK